MAARLADQDLIKIPLTVMVAKATKHMIKNTIERCILALPHWEMACCAVSAPSEMKLRGKPSALART